MAKKDGYILIRINEQEKLDLQRIAESLDISMSQLIRVAIRNEIATL